MFGLHKSSYYKRVNVYFFSIHSGHENPSLFSFFFSEKKKQIIICKLFHFYSISIRSSFKTPQKYIGKNLERNQDNELKSNYHVTKLIKKICRFYVCWIACAFLYHAYSFIQCVNANSFLLFCLLTRSFYTSLISFYLASFPLHTIFVAYRWSKSQNRFRWQKYAIQNVYTLYSYVGVRNRYHLPCTDFPIVNVSEWGRTYIRYIVCITYTHAIWDFGFLHLTFLEDFFSVWCDLNVSNLQWYCVRTVSGTKSLHSTSNSLYGCMLAKSFRMPYPHTHTYRAKNIEGQWQQQIGVTYSCWCDAFRPFFPSVREYVWWMMLFIRRVSQYC